MHFFAPVPRLPVKMGAVQYTACNVKPRSVNSFHFITLNWLAFLAESVSRSIRLWDTIGYIIHGLHLTAGSEVMNRHFYHTPTTDFNLVLIRLMQQLERFADTSLSKKMADIIMGKVIDHIEAFKTFVLAETLSCHLIYMRLNISGSICLGLLDTEC